MVTRRGLEVAILAQKCEDSDPYSEVYGGEAVCARQRDTCPGTVRSKRGWKGWAKLLGRVEPAGSLSIGHPI